MPRRLWRLTRQLGATSLTTQIGKSSVIVFLVVVVLVLSIFQNPPLSRPSPLLLFVPEAHGG